MDVAVIGTGNVGGALGRALHRAGLRVTFGSTSRAGGELDGIEITDLATALGRARVVLLAVPGPAVAALVAAHREELRGALVIDATNNLASPDGPSAHGQLRDSGARYARAFNTLGWENFEHPTFGGERADLFFSCDHPADAGTVAELITAVGLRPVDVGVGQHEVVDGLLPLWFALSRTRGRHLAFRLLTDA